MDENFKWGLGAVIMLLILSFLIVPRVTMILLTIVVLIGISWAEKYISFNRIAIHEEVFNAFIREFILSLKKLFGNNIAYNYLKTHVINERHYSFTLDILSYNDIDEREIHFASQLLIRNYETYKGRMFIKAIPKLEIKEIVYFNGHLTIIFDFYLGGFYE